MMKIYLAGPITGLPNGNKQTFKRIQEELEKKGHKVINPHELFTQDEIEKFKHNDFMRRCIPEVCNADMVVTLPEWMESKGASQEVDIARMFDIPVIPSCRILNTDYAKAIPQH